VRLECYVGDTVNFVLDALIDFNKWKDLRTGEIWQNVGVLDTVRVTE